MPLYLLDLIGVFAFSVYGAYIGLKKDLDIFGITVCAILTALGGGTVREIILNRIPFYYHDYHYIYVVFIGVIFSILTFRNFNKIDKYMLIVDAVGLSTFSLIGAERVLGAHLGFFGAVFFAVITALGGSFLRDILINEVPKTLSQDFYATPSITLATLYYLFRNYMHEPLNAYLLIFFIFAIRVFAIQTRANIWAPYRAHKKTKLRKK